MVSLSRCLLAVRKILAQPVSHEEKLNAAAATRSEPATGTGPEWTDRMIGQLRLSVRAENRRISWGYQRSYRTPIVRYKRNTEAIFSNPLRLTKKMAL
jgi:hypothetical protein